MRPKPDFETRWKDDIIAIWARPIEKLPVHTDVPRLAKKITIKSDAGIPCTSILKGLGLISHYPH